MKVTDTNYPGYSSQTLVSKAMKPSASQLSYDLYKLQLLEVACGLLAAR